jgi:hypothetical protein
MFKGATDEIAFVGRKWKRIARKEEEWCGMEELGVGQVLK